MKTSSIKLVIGCWVYYRAVVGLESRPDLAQCVTRGFFLKPGLEQQFLDLRPGPLQKKSPDPALVYYSIIELRAW